MARPTRPPGALAGFDGDDTLRSTRVVLAAAHLDHDPTHNRLRNLRALCQRCHMLNDRPHHLIQRWITYRRRWAMGDLFLGLYPAEAPFRRPFSHLPAPAMAATTVVVGNRPISELDKALR